MGIRDEEIKRLVSYAQAMGTKVIFSQKSSGNDMASWLLDGTEITVYEKEHKTKIDLVLTLIHEIAHACEFIRNNNRQFDHKLEEAIGDEEEKKKHRKKMYEWEEKGLQWWEEIYRDVNCKFPIYKLYIAKDFDIWQYQVYYETGKFPSGKNKAQKYKDLKEKWRKT